MNIIYILYMYIYTYVYIYSYTYNYIYIYAPILVIDYPDSIFSTKHRNPLHVNRVNSNYNKNYNATNETKYYRYMYRVCVKSLSDFYSPKEEEL